MFVIYVIIQNDMHIFMHSFNVNTTSLRLYAVEPMTTRCYIDGHVTSLNTELTSQGGVVKIVWSILLSDFCCFISDYCPYFLQL